MSLAEKAGLHHIESLGMRAKNLTFLDSLYALPPEEAWPRVRSVIDTYVGAPDESARLELEDDPRWPRFRDLVTASGGWDDEDAPPVSRETARRLLEASRPLVTDANSNDIFEKNLIEEQSLFPEGGDRYTLKAVSAPAENRHHFSLWVWYPDTGDETEGDYKRFEGEFETPRAALNRIVSLRLQEKLAAGTLGHHLEAQTALAEMLTDPDAASAFTEDVLRKSAHAHLAEAARESVRSGLQERPRQLLLSNLNTYSAGNSEALASSLVDTYARSHEDRTLSMSSVEIARLLTDIADRNPEALPFVSQFAESGGRALQMCSQVDALVDQRRAETTHQRWLAATDGGTPYGVAREMLKGCDWWYEYSDDPSVRRRGAAHIEKTMDAALLVPRDVRECLWATYGGRDAWPMPLTKAELSEETRPPMAMAPGSMNSAEIPKILPGIADQEGASPPELDDQHLQEIADAVADQAGQITPKHRRGPELA